MNDETKAFVEDAPFESLYEGVRLTKKLELGNYPTENLRLLGYVLVEFQRLEEAIHMAFIAAARISHLDQLRWVVTTKASFGTLCNMLLAQCQISQMPHIGSVEMAVKKANKAEEIRNQLIHSYWSYDGRMKYTMGREKGIQIKSERYTDAELQLIVNQIVRITETIYGLRSKFLQEHMDRNAPNEPLSRPFITKPEPFVPEPRSTD